MAETILLTNNEGQPANSVASEMPMTLTVTYTVPCVIALDVGALKKNSHRRTFDLWL